MNKKDIEFIKKFKIIVIVGEHGTGKTVLAQYLKESWPEVQVYDDISRDLWPKSNVEQSNWFYSLLEKDQQSIVCLDYFHSYLYYNLVQLIKKSSDILFIFTSMNQELAHNVKDCFNAAKKLIIDFGNKFQKAINKGTKSRPCLIMPIRSLGIGFIKTYKMHRNTKAARMIEYQKQSREISSNLLKELMDDLNTRKVAKNFVRKHIDDPNITKAADVLKKALVEDQAEIIEDYRNKLEDVLKKEFRNG